ncbi:triphosphoribosyl-dephospho-CoA synthase [Klebsiella pneumoniae subsp. pneumoniae]|nr:triphosphoribosyl-dephospho-CoA synthase [Klebsiella pneumoniae subsp. pneumoniae]
MAHCDDTTVLFRGGQQALAEMKQYAPASCDAGRNV